LSKTVSAFPCAASEVELEDPYILLYDKSLF
jgi:hypothetical protein